MGEPQRESLLGGYRVLDLTDEKGLLCGKILGDMGAEVIKIEPPEGDPARNRGPFYKDIPHPEKSLFWFFTNLNKKSITLNLESVEGRDILKRLVKTADFLVESFDPGYMDSLDLGYSNLEEINPRLVVTSISPFGQTGPYAHYQVSDIVSVAMGGMVRILGDMDRPPVRIGQPQAYFLGGLHGAMGSMVAHYHQELTGEGQHVDVSIQQAVVLALMIAAEICDILKFNYRGFGQFIVVPRPTPPGPLFARFIYPCKDGHVLAWIGGGAQAGIVSSTRALVEVANQKGLALELKDYDWPGLDSQTAAQEEVNRIQEIMSQFLLTKTKAELFEAALNRSILLIPVTTVGDVVESPQLKAREFFVSVEHPELGQVITYPGWPIKMSQLPPYQPQRRAPLVGEHNEEIYHQELGLSKEELVLLKTHGVI